MTTTPTPGVDYAGRRLNPDTELSMPSPSAAQQQLADNVLALLLDGPLVVGGSDDVDLIREALIEVAVRQHGRTTRAHIAELRGNADSYDRDARATLANTTPDGGPIDLRQLAVAEQLATGAATLRTTMLRGYSA